MNNTISDFKSNLSRNKNRTISNFITNIKNNLKLPWYILLYLLILFLIIIAIIVLQYLTIYGESNILTMIFSKDPVSLREQIFNNDNKNIIKTSIVINYLLIICLFVYIFIYNKKLKLNKYLLTLIFITFIFYLVGLSFITEFIFNNNNDIITNTHKSNLMKFTVILMNYKNLLISILISMYLINKNII